MFADRTNWDLSTNRLAEALARYRTSGRKLFDLSASNPTECGFRYDEPAILAALQQPAALEYHPDPRGLPSARKAIRDHYAAQGSEVSMEDIILTASTSEAYSFAFRLLCNPGDEFLIPAPSYPLFEFLADIQDVNLNRYPLFYDHGWHIDFHALHQNITPRTRGLIVVHPNNPTGHFTKTAELAKLNEICSKHALSIIADEVFFDFVLDAGPRRSFVANADVLTFTMSGLSKISGLPQMKLAWLLLSGPQEQKREALARLEVIADTYLSPSAPIQLAACTLLQQRYDFQRQVFERVRRNLGELDAQLAKQKSCRRLAIEGGWYAVLRVPALRPDEALAIELLEEHGVFVHPGHFYGFASEGYLVVSLIVPGGEFAEGIARVMAKL
jgi:aspartate/methionine/tyrosine aminotransferase